MSKVCFELRTLYFDGPSYQMSDSSHVVSSEFVYIFFVFQLLVFGYFHFKFFRSLHIKCIFKQFRQLRKHTLVSDNCFESLGLWVVKGFFAFKVGLTFVVSKIKFEV